MKKTAKTMGIVIGGIFALTLLLGLLKTLALPLLIGGLGGVWYFYAKNPDKKKMMIFAGVAFLGLVGFSLPEEEATTESAGTKTEEIASESSISKEDKAQAEKEAAVKKAKEEEAAALKQKEAEEKAAADAAAKEEAARIKAEEEAAAQAKAEEEAAAEAAALARLQDKASYRWDISYDQLARTPDDYLGQLVAMSGKVLQVMEGDGKVQLRVGVNDDYNTVAYLEYDSTIIPERILEDDYINFYGMSYGLLTYKSTMGGNITIPAFSVNMIERQ